MKKLTTLLMTLMLMSMTLWAEETITVSANSTDISEGLDLKVVAKLFAEAKNLEEFETMLNNPDSAFCNLDLNGDGQVDYLRVVETGEGNKRLIVLQAILAKDIYQDVASIYVEKDEKNEVSVQVVGDEYVYGSNYIIEPVYVYRPVIYDWLWRPYWSAWYSPYYWGYYPSWWYYHSCWAHDWYWRHCFAYHHHHHWCSFRPGHTLRHGYHDLHHGVSHRDYAVAHPERSFSSRNVGMTNAREIRNTGSVRGHHSGAGMDRNAAGPRVAHNEHGAAHTGSRTFGSTNTAYARTNNANSVSRGESARSSHTMTRSEATSRTNGATQGRSTEVTSSRSTSATATRPTHHTSTRSTSATSTRSTNATPTRSESTTRSSGTTNTRSTSSTSTSTRRSGSTSGRSTSSTVSQPSRSSSSSSSSSSRTSGSYRSSGSHSSGSHSSGSYSGGGSSRSGGSYSGGHSGGGSSRGGSSSGGSRGGGGHSSRR